MRLVSGYTLDDAARYTQAITKKRANSFIKQVFSPGAERDAVAFGSH
jgi:hypothetical protein